MSQGQTALPVAESEEDLPPLDPQLGSPLVADQSSAPIMTDPTKSEASILPAPTLRYPNQTLIAPGKSATPGISESDTTPIKPGARRPKGTGKEGWFTCTPSSWRTGDLALTSKKQ